MVRVPIRTCPNLSLLFERAEPALLTCFFNSRAFQRQEWLGAYKNILDRQAQIMLQKEPKERLGPLETEASRIVAISASRGQYALEGIAETKLSVDRRNLLVAQRDELTRSLWAYINEPMLFEGTENSLHMKLYRRYDRHYQTFMADPSGGVDAEAGATTIASFLEVVGKALNRGKGYKLERFDIPGDGEVPSSELYMLFHPKSPTSVREISDEGELTNVYVRAPGEATVVYVPSTGRLHIRAATRALRHLIAERFIENILQQQVSSQPVDFQAYDIRRFRNFGELSRPAYPDVVVETAKIIKVEVSVGDLGNRLALSTTIDNDLGEVARQQDGLLLAFENAIATRAVEFAVKYRRKGQENVRTLNFAVTDRNTCSLLSVEDPFETALGHRLMQDWGVLREGRAPTSSDSRAALPALLVLWEVGSEKVSGAWLLDRRVDANLLIEIGFLVPAGAGDEVDVDVVDDEDSIGPVAAEVLPHLDNPMLRISPGQEFPAGQLASYVVYRVRKNWVAQHLCRHLASELGYTGPVTINEDLVRIGLIDVDGTDVPVYLARGLSADSVRELVDADLWENRSLGIGLVLQAGHAPGSCISRNILVAATDHLTGMVSNPIIDVESLRDACRTHFMFGRSADSVNFETHGKISGTLYVPHNKSIFISGEHRFQVIKTLVDAHRSGHPRVTSNELRKGIEGQSLSNIFGSKLWKRLQDGFVRQPKRPYWEIAADSNSAPTPFAKSD